MLTLVFSRACTGWRLWQAWESIRIHFDYSGMDADLNDETKVVLKHALSCAPQKHKRYISGKGVGDRHGLITI